ncbi:hypothetical protein B0H94_110103 [Salsuginibacillus halophilus]|uniref:Amidohydrolase 3 domain-containing protein n=1 Tax=Salsuginibacillus halophilus TaxID=517424 RepID=A0A2P8HBM8_9BACI|nr:amidohydrolase [Salsuginibacillus halophilus]PSL43627.1 hypothetical protein B0H94_110103 [Salsuginibacillus halophilus]
MATLWYGGKLRPLNSAEAEAEAVITDGGKIQSVGETAALRSAWRSQITEEVNLDGGVMYPGFVDSHLHMIGVGETMLRLDLSEVRSYESLKKAVSERREQLTPGAWLLGEGWNENEFEHPYIPTLHELDDLAPSQPMVLTRICRHAVLANSLALKLAGITKDTKDPEGGRIERDAHGEPTGYLHETAQDLVRAVIPEKSEAFLRQALETAVDHMHAYGLTGGHTEDLSYYNGYTSTTGLFHEVLRQPGRKLRTHLLVHEHVLDDFLSASVEQTALMTFGAVKIFADGALGGRTAWLSEPYSDNPATTGVQIHTDEGLQKVVERARGAGKAVAVHAIGDSALEQVLDALEAYPAPKGLKDRIIHAEVVRPDLVRRLMELPVVIDAQPRFLASDFPWAYERLGSERVKHVLAWRTLLNSGIACAGGSDAPIEPVDPRLGMHAAVTRCKPGEVHEGYVSEEKITAFEALQMFTIRTAEAEGMAHRRGVIAPGYDADFTVLSEDLLTTEPDIWLETDVKMTIVDETIVYNRT